MSGKEESREQARALLHSLSDIDDRYLAEAVEEEERQNTAGHAGGRKLRKYTGFALTAAACLTVAIVGRYVTLHRHADLPEEKTAAPVAVQTEAQQMDDVLYEAEAAGEAQPSVNAAYDAGTAADMQEKAAPEDDMQAAAAPAAGMAQIANPFTDAGTLEEAQDIAGFAFSVPEEDIPHETLAYRAAEHEMIEVIFLDEEGEEYCRVRKAAGDDDISGDYEEYAGEKTMDLPGGITLTVRGEEEDRWMTAVWTKEDPADRRVYSYAVCAAKEPFTTEQIRRIAQTMSAGEK